ncbi:MAG: glutamate racemase [Candidatus Coproplasma sp.]
METENFNLTRPVCVFDSGIGGLTLFAECVKKYKNTDFAYFADNYNVPYGNLPPERICSLTERIFEKIARFNPCAVVIACNTATATCADRLRKRYDFPVLGIQPAVKPAAEHGGKILVLATQATVNSASFAKLIARYGTEKTVVRACPNLAEYIERNVALYPDIDVSGFLPDVEADCVVLGCTHYTFVKNAIAKRYGCAIFDGIAGTVDHLKPFLGIDDHTALNQQKIAFIGGNYDKNREIYRRLNQNSTDK